jgi:hypothetical protein
MTDARVLRDHEVGSQARRNLSAVAKRAGSSVASPSGSVCARMRSADRVAGSTRPRTMREREAARQAGAMPAPQIADWVTREVLPTRAPCVQPI